MLGNEPFGKALVLDFEKEVKIPKVTSDLGKVEKSDFEGEIVWVTNKGYGGRSKHTDFAIDVLLNKLPEDKIYKDRKLLNNADLIEKKPGKNYFVHQDIHPSCGGDRNQLPPNLVRFTVEEKSNEKGTCTLDCDRPYKIAVQLWNGPLGEIFRAYSDVWFKNFIKKKLIPALVEADELDRADIASLDAVEHFNDAFIYGGVKPDTNMMMVKKAYESAYGENTQVEKQFPDGTFDTMTEFFGNPSDPRKGSQLEKSGYNAWINKLQVSINKSNAEKEIWLQSCGLVATLETKKKLVTDPKYELEAKDSEWDNNGPPVAFMWSGPILLPKICAGIIWPDFHDTVPLIRVQYILEAPGEQTTWKDSPFAWKKVGTKNEHPSSLADGIYKIQPHYVQSILDDLGAVKVAADGAVTFNKSGDLDNKRLFWSTPTQLRFGNRLAGFRGDFR